MPKEQADRCLAGQFCGLLAIGADARHIDVGNEVVAVRALEHEHLHGVVGLGLLNERDEIADQFRPEQIHGWRRDICEQNAAFLAYDECFERHKHDDDATPACVRRRAIRTYGHTIA